MRLISQKELIRPFCVPDVWIKGSSFPLLIQRRDANSSTLLLEERPVSDDIDFDALARITEGLISSDLKLIVNNASLKALQENALISMALLVEEASQFKPSLSQADLDKYLEFEAYKRD